MEMYFMSGIVVALFLNKSVTIGKILFKNI